MWEKLAAKAFSGRYLLTVASALVFVYCSVRGILRADTVATIVGMVFTMYFQRTDRNGPNKPT